MKNIEEMTVRELVELGGEVKSPQRVSSDKAFKKKLAQKDQRSFVQIKDKGAKNVNQTLTLTQAGTLFGLMAYIGDNQGNLISEKEKLGTEQLAKLLKTSKASLQRNIGELISLGYVIANKEGRKVVYAVSPYLAIRGEKNDNDLFSKLYVVELRKLIQTLTLPELGMLFMMIPYFNTRFYTLCRTPYELDANKVELFDRERFADEIGVSLVQVKRLIASLLKKQALVGLRTCRTALIITPKLVSRQNRFVTIEEVTDVIGNELNVRERMEW